MLLLNLAISMIFREIYRKFQYASIKPNGEKIALVRYPQFTFQYASIKPTWFTTQRIRSRCLHFNMLLLNLNQNELSEFSHI